jgi:flagellar M-ring protein FliF
MSSGASTSDTSDTSPLGRAKAALAFVREKAMALPRAMRILIASTVAAALVIGGVLVWRAGDVRYAVLFSGLDRDDASATLAKLKEMKIPFRVEGDGSILEVPEEKVREIRLELAGAGLPRGGGIGFEGFDKMRLGATEFEQRVLFRRALEGELSRTIDTIGAVQSTRVHLVLPERSVFVGKSEPATASIVLKLRAGRALGGGEVSGIVHLVASSVAGLAAERVAVVTTDGTMLHKPRHGEGSELGGAGGDDEQGAAARSLEATLEERARQMLEKVVGAGHVDVRVTAELDRARVERVEEHFDPKSHVLRSEEQSVERAPGEPAIGGVPGAESNLPGANGKGAGADAGVTEAFLRESHTRNFEVDKVSEKRLVPSGSTLRRLTVAVVLDESAFAGRAGRSAADKIGKEELDRMTSLVRSAVGADERRGDRVTVDAAPFLEVAKTIDAPVPGPPLYERIPRKYWPHVAGGALALVLVSLLLARRAWKKRQKVATARESAAREALVLAEATPAEAEVESGESELVREINSLDGAGLRRLVHERCGQDPASAALVLRFWLGPGPEREVPPPPVVAPEKDGIQVA